MALHYRCFDSFGVNAIISQALGMPNACNKPHTPYSKRLPLASPVELSDFLKDVEKRAFKRTMYHVRNDESALDIVQDSMMKLAQSYGDKPADELPLLFQRILSNTTLDWFRRQKVKNALFSSFSDFQSGVDDGDDFDVLESLSRADTPPGFDNPQTSSERMQTLQQIEKELLLLPGRQREAFLLRYWEDMDVSETAAAMGCSQGSVKTHCSRAVQALFQALTSRGIKP
ncbi:RNA polymerase sigma-E factor [mine drainage metagenome]|uniref:RNA polymerase sigma-E factor n=1 Tax=mine drainage metagenome TaxID=410659 RepID=A0A1J5PPV2_9ZZZZ